MKTIAGSNMIRIGATGDYCDGCEHDIDEVNCTLFLERKDGGSVDGRKVVVGRDVGALDGIRVMVGGDVGGLEVGASVRIG